jgi:hypothetical protein
MRTFVTAALLTVALPTIDSARAGTNAEVRQVLDRTIKAMGGEAKAARLRTVAWKGSARLNIDGKEITVKHDGLSQGWDLYKLDLDIQIEGMPLNLQVVLNRDKAWANQGGKVEEAPQKDVKPFRDMLNALRLVQMLPALKEKDVKLSHLGELKVGDRPTVGLTVSRKGRADVSIFFDKENGLPLKTSVRAAPPGSQGQEKEFEFLFSDYKDFDGVKHRTKITTRVDGNEIVIELSEVRPREKLDASTFARPE